MKKIFAIAMAVVMLFAMTVAVSADEVLLSEDILFMHAGNWEQTEWETTLTDFLAACATPGAEFRITRSAPTDVVYPAEGAYEKFVITDGWWAFQAPEDGEDGATSNTLRLGTGQHTQAAAEESVGKVYDVHVDCLWDDGTVVAYLGQDIVDAFTNWMPENHGDNVVFVSNTSTTSYDIINISVVVPDEPYVAPEVEEAPAEEPAVETEEPAVEAEETPAETGLALSLIPAAIALAVVVLKRR